MKLVVVGIGQCGGRIADEFARLNSRARSRRGMTIITGCFAVNTDAADLSGLSSINKDHRHRILIGGRKTQCYLSGGFFYILCLQYGADYRHRVSAGGYNLRCVVSGDAADSDQGQGYRLPYLAQSLRPHHYRRFLGRGGVH